MAGTDASSMDCLSCFVHDHRSMAASETSSRTTGAKGKGKKKGASAKDETAPEKEDGKEALSQVPRENKTFGPI
jgi:hypothetical protein